MSQNPFDRIKKTIEVNGEKYQYFSLPDLADPRVGTTLVPFCLAWAWAGSCETVQFFPSPGG
jgi:hypothetical protein